IFFVIWLIFGWVGTIGIPLTLLQRRWSEWIVISSESFVYGQKGFLVRKPKTIPISTIFKIGIGRYAGEYDQTDRDSMVSLNIHCFTSKKRKRHRSIGFWLHPKLKEEVFQRIQEFANKHQLPVQFQ